jgi:CDP-6-deoxy-D-xylo-4-hexulose-3-dehydrase
MQEILSLVSDYIKEKNQKNKWKIGDQVNYAGTVYDEKEYVAAVESILSGWFGLGKAASHFESMFPRELGKKFGILTNSGSSANLLMYASLKSRRSFNLPEGTKILTPVAGFPTTINPILQLGFTPIFVDIELSSLNLDLYRCEELIVKHDVKVISFAHVLGNPPDMDWVMYLVDKYKLILLEDCCDALGSKYDGRFIGSFGSMATCSFYPAHHISLGEGGFVATNSTDQHTILKSLRDWGRGCYCQGSAANNLKCGTCGKRFSEWLPELKGEVFDHKYVYDEIGYNLKPIEMQAAIGMQQLKKLGAIIAERQYNFKRLSYIYETYYKYFILPIATNKSNPSWFAFPLTLRENAPFTRDEYVNYLESKNIQTRPYFAGNILLQPGYSDIAKKYGISPKSDFPNATYVTRNTFFHGVSPVINDDQLDYIDDVVTEFMRRY